MKGLYCTHSFLPFSLTIIGSRSQGVQGLGIDNTSQGAFSCVTCTCIIIVPPVHAHLGGGGKVFLIIVPCTYNTQRRNSHQSDFQIMLFIEYKYLFILSAVWAPLCGDTNQTEGK